MFEAIAFKATLVIFATHIANGSTLQKEYHYASMKECNTAKKQVASRVYKTKRTCIPYQPKTFLSLLSLK